MRYVTIIILIMCSLYFMNTPYLYAETDTKEKKIDEQLGAWISDRDTSMWVFFSDNTFLRLNKNRATYGNWLRKEGTKYILISFPGEIAPEILSITKDKFTFYHGDYSDSGFLRILLGNGYSRKINIKTYDIAKGSVP